MYYNLYINSKCINSLPLTEEQKNRVMKEREIFKKLNNGKLDKISVADIHVVPCIYY